MYIKIRINVCIADSFRIKFTIFDAPPPIHTHASVYSVSIYTAVKNNTVIYHQTTTVTRPQRLIKTNRVFAQ